MPRTLRLIQAGACLGALFIMTAPALAERHDWAPRGALLRNQVRFLKVLPFAACLGLGLGLAAGWRARRGRQERATDGKVARHAPLVIAAHWVNAVGIMLAMATGIVQYRLLWRSAPLDRVYQLHFVGASMVVFAVALYLAHALTLGRYGILWRRGDLARLLLQVRRRNRPGDREAGKYSPYSRLVSFPIWAFIIALALVTGALKAFRYIYNPLPGPVLFFISALHVSTLFLAGAKLLEHLIRYLALPSHWGLLRSMFGRPLSRAYVQERHPAWYRELFGAEGSIEEREPPGNRRPGLPKPESGQPVA
ncbi:MAG: cytochrome b/b6 domain-containing protein [Candidatus Tectomicrobia bacterium]|nr:cytochrome b/b6 domain-containing protein [Candidatus Tectomicrobia bacterium]